MQFGLYAPIPMATVGSPEVAQAVSEALAPLPAGRRDAQFDLGVELLEAADSVGFDLVLEEYDNLEPSIAESLLGGSYLATLRGTFIGIKTGSPT